MVGIKQDIYYKQKGLFDPAGKQPVIHVYGCGSIGSHVILGLAKTGFTNITVYDIDIVEDDNLPAQNYATDYVGERKVDAIREHVYTMTGNYITVHHGKISASTNFDKTLESIHIIAFDNIEGRKNVLAGLSGFPVYIIDGRIGGFNYEIYSIKANDSLRVKSFEESLTGDFSEELCTEKCLWGVNSMISSWILGSVLTLVRGNSFPWTLKGNLLSQHVIASQEDR